MWVVLSTLVALVVLGGSFYLIVSFKDAPSQTFGLVTAVCGGAIGSVTTFFFVNHTAATSSQGTNGTTAQIIDGLMKAWATTPGQAVPSVRVTTPDLGPDHPSTEIKVG